MYVQIADWVAARIESGALAPGRPIPSEKILQQQFPVARETVRHAVAELRDRGLIYTVPQRGSYVSRPEDR